MVSLQSFSYYILLKIIFKIISYFFVLAKTFLKKYTDFKTISFLILFYIKEYIYEPDP